MAAPGDFGKPRPAVIVQADALTHADFPSVVVCLLSSHCLEAPAFRISLEPTAANGLHQPSQIMVDKLLTVPRNRLGAAFGRIDDETLVRLNRTLAFVAGLAE